jgi:hypothetical protein
VCRACGGGAIKLGAETRRHLRAAIAGHEGAEAWSDAARAESRRALAAFVEQQLGRPLAMPEIVEALDRRARRVRGTEGEGTTR